MRAESGQVIALFAMGILFFVALIVVVGDNALVRMQARNLQNTADAAAMAGVQDLPHNPTLALQKAEEYANKNISGLSGYHAELLEENHKIRVTVSKHSGALFGGALTLGDPVVTKVAAAMVEAAPGASFGVIILHHTRCEALHLNSDSVLNVPNGGLYVNSDSQCSDGAAHLNSDSGVNAQAIYIRGRAVAKSGSWFSPAPQGLENPVPDPYAEVEPPSYSTGAPTPNVTGSGSRSGSCGSGGKWEFKSGTWSFPPGYYNCTLMFDGNVTGVFQNGVFVVTKGIELNSGAKIDATAGVLIYNLSEEIVLNSDTWIDINPYGEPFSNIAIWQLQSGEKAFELNSQSKLTSDGGSIYVPNGQLWLNSFEHAQTEALQIVVSELELNSGSELNVAVTAGMPTLGGGWSWAMVE